jgi:hypothetical protein
MLAKPLVNQREWLTIKEAAQLTGDNENSIQQLIRSRKVKTRRRAQSVFVNRASLLAVERQPAEPTHALHPSQVALAAIETRPPLEQQQRNAEAIRLLTEWSNATGKEAADQADTLAYLIDHLDQHRASSREIFPNELKEQLRQAIKHDE